MERVSMQPLFSCLKLTLKSDILFETNNMSGTTTKSGTLHQNVVRTSLSSRTQAHKFCAFILCFVLKVKQCVLDLVCQADLVRMFTSVGGQHEK